MLTVGSLFSGIGGFDLGLEQAGGFEIRWQCENDPYCRRVLAEHWPDVPCFEDVHDCGAHNLEEVDVICGGFPCQPVSTAGKQLAQDDERWLWPEYARVIRELRPKHCLVENVSGLLVRGLGDVLGDLAVLGYDAEWGCVSAASVGAPHLRKRIFIVGWDTRRRDDGERRDTFTGVQKRPDAFSSGIGQNGPGQGRTKQRRSMAHANGYSSSRYKGAMGRTETEVQGGKEQFQSRSPVAGSGQPIGSHWATEPNVGRVAHGVPARVDRLRGLGNAIVPQVAEWIGRRLMAMSRIPSEGETP